MYFRSTFSYICHTIYNKHIKKINIFKTYLKIYNTQMYHFRIFVSTLLTYGRSPFSPYPYPTSRNQHSLYKVKKKKFFFVDSICTVFTIVDNSNSSPLYPYTK